jgi:superfamily II DNA/RNA helicase
MPCRSDYMEHTDREVESARVASLLCFVLPLVGKEVTEEMKDSCGYYGNLKKIDEYTKLLCSTIRSMNEQQINEIVYNAHNRSSRELANWWEEHQEHDKIRAEKITEKQKQKKHAELIKKFKNLSIEEQEKLLHGK